MTTKHNDSAIDMIRYIAKDELLPDFLEYRIKEENPEHYEEYMEIVKKEGSEHLWISAEGYHCRIWRNHMGVWCGYVTVPKSHPAFGKHYDDVDVDVHGGLTYSESEGHDDIWVLGFDCGHAGDIIIGMSTSWDGATYKDKAYVTVETNSLSIQLGKMVDNK